MNKALKIFAQKKKTAPPNAKIKASYHVFLQKDVILK